MPSIPLNHNRTRFSATIHVCSDDQLYANAYKNYGGQVVSGPYTYQERASFAKSAITSHIYMCQAGGITNGSHVSFFHLFPRKILWALKDAANFDEPVKIYQEEPPDYSLIFRTLRALMNDIRQLRAECHHLRGFLTGGLSNDFGSPVLKTVLLKLFQKAKIPYAIVYGQAPGFNSQLHYTAITDTWTVFTGDSRLRNPDTDKWVFTQNPLSAPNLTARQRVQKLKEIYEDVRIERDDNLVINGLDIPMAIRIDEGITPREARRQGASRTKQPKPRAELVAFA